ncbi:MAG: DUF1175 family protein [Acidobacteriota bacterium]|nr:DUF1175 family protein [Acidobacteriota bacterium]
MRIADSFILAWLILPGIMFLTVGCGAAPKAVAERRNPAPTATTAAWNDHDEDGIPDAAELHSFDDRMSFRRWFAAIAEMQFYQLNERWSEDQRDCAGLVRFAWREALRRHDRIWFQAMGQGYEAVAPDVKAISLEKNPLGERLFRTEFGAFAEGDLAGKFSEFADAKTLKNYNSEFVTRDRRQLAQLQPGDLLFFHQPWVQKFPYHVMIFLGEARHASEGANDWVIYHTGASADDKGEMKKVRLAVLAEHPNPRWRPVENNQNFLGFYRLEILN